MPKLLDTRFGHWMNYQMAVRAARKATRASITQRYDAAHSNLLRLLENVGESEWALPTAYPDRSVEALRNYEAPDGTVWPLVVTALALLGETAPGIDTLAEITDLYGIAASRVNLPAKAFQPDDTAPRQRATQPKWCLAAGGRGAPDHPVGVVAREPAAGTAT